VAFLILININVQRSEELSKLNKMYKTLDQIGESKLLRIYLDLLENEKNLSRHKIILEQTFRPETKHLHLVLIFEL